MEYVHKMHITYKYIYLIHFNFFTQQRYPDQDGKTDGSETQQNQNQKLYYHRIGESQAKDVLVVQFNNEPSWRLYA